MADPVKTTEQSPAGEPIPSGVWEALQRPSGKNKPAARSYASFNNAADDLVDATDASNKRNRHALLCPRPGCGSLILLAGVAKFVEGESVQVSLVSPGTIRRDETYLSGSSSVASKSSHPQR